MPRFHKRAEWKLWESTNREKRKRWAHTVLWAICMHVTHSALHCKRRFSTDTVLYTKSDVAWERKSKRLNPPSEQPVLGALSWHMRTCWPCQCTRRSLQGKTLSKYARLKRRIFSSKPFDISISSSEKKLLGDILDALGIKTSRQLKEGSGSNVS